MPNCNFEILCHYVFNIVVYFVGTYFILWDGIIKCILTFLMLPVALDMMLKRALSRKRV